MTILNPEVQVGVSALLSGFPVKDMHNSKCSLNPNIVFIGSKYGFLLAVTAEVL